MGIGLLLILGIYGLSIAVMHAVFRGRRNKRQEPEHVVLVTRNNEQMIEGYLASLYAVNRLRGRQVAVTIFDNGSTDETRAIIERCAGRYESITYETTTDRLDAFLAEHQEHMVKLVRLEQAAANRDLSAARW
ncbi:hypothetical protein J31TS4_42580 [Paenibacillus sp. J31TS4]|uniref:glycosyltransferase n=1 Tax=Paenibacillus sp. J31TS4 TaxID=2807195 RepID=UPI001B2B8B6F|nr:glycosyltransferase [Paenibacillus sp. J31TS4]GIP40978.1 hypothetical protein J31TS4_42580 [Paenibacillus sp. J31TS4]